MSRKPSIKIVGNQNQSAHVGRDHIGDVIFNPPPPDAAVTPQPELEPPKVRLLPLTERWLQTISAVLTIVTAAGLWNAVQTALDDFDAGGPMRVWPLYAAIAGVALTVGFWCMVVFLRKRTSWYPTTGVIPVLAGIADHRGRGRLALVRYRGKCPHDGGKLKFYRKPLTTIAHRNPETGHVKREVTDREPAAECKKYERHWWPIDPTDIRSLDGVE